MARSHVITRLQDAFVIEDADHLLKPRSDGNEHLHRFLTTGVSGVAAVALQRRRRALRP
jgi:hypothetical protein